MTEGAARFGDRLVPGAVHHRCGGRRRLRAARTRDKQYRVRASRPRWCATTSLLNFHSHLKRLASCHSDVIRPAARMARCGTASHWRSSKTTMPRRNEDESECAAPRGVPERFRGVQTGLFFRGQRIPTRSPGPRLTRRRSLGHASTRGRVSNHFGDFHQRLNLSALGRPPGAVYQDSAGGTTSEATITPISAPANTKMSTVFIVNSPKVDLA